MVKRLSAISLICVVSAMGVIALARPAAQQPSGVQPAPAGTTGEPARGVPNVGRGQGGRGGGRGQVPGPDANMDAHYRHGPDSMPHDGVPEGTIEGPFVIPSHAFPGTQHTYWVYVPAQYDRTVPASLMIYNDGLGYMHPTGRIRATHVMDNLIYRREIPVMIGVFINPGRRPDQQEATADDWGDRTTNRPEEYNSIDDRYARVIVDELMPELNVRYNISTDPERRGIAGSSSGAIAAFGVAWHRPDEFRKVISLIGTFVNLGGRGGHTYAQRVRESDRKPIRIFLQDGRNDNRFADEQMDWFLNNVRLKDALESKGYDVAYSWGVHTHTSWASGTQYPEMMRWLWRDHGVSTDPRDLVERSYREPAASDKAQPATPVP
jgi:enterochelin esterase-like enzyme